MVKIPKHRELVLIALAALSAVFAQQPASDPAALARDSYARRCASCHGNDAAGTDRGPSLNASRRLRTRSHQEVRDIVRNGTPAGMPPFALPEAEMEAIVLFVRGMNASAFDLNPPGDAAAGERFFFGEGQVAIVTDSNLPVLAPDQEWLAFAN